MRGPRHHFAGDVLDEAAVVLGVRRRACRERFLRCVADEKPLASDAEVITALARIDLGSVRPQPRYVPLESLVPRLRTRSPRDPPPLP
jgi:hypothetical protein